MGNANIVNPQQSQTGFTPNQLASFSQTNFYQNPQYLGNSGLGFGGFGFGVNDMGGGLLNTNQLGVFGGRAPFMNTWGGYSSNTTAGANKVFGNLSNTANANLNT